MTDRDPKPLGWPPRRPWCLPCRELCGDTAFAHINGVVCEWHWGILTDEDQKVLADAIRERRPNGGKVTSVLEQIWVVRGTLRRVPNTVVATWKAEAKDSNADDDHKVGDWHIYLPQFIQSDGVR